MRGDVVWYRVRADLVVIAHVAFIVFVAVDSLLAGTLSVDELLRRRHRLGRVNGRGHAAAEELASAGRGSRLPMSK